MLDTKMIQISLSVETAELLTVHITAPALCLQQSWELRTFLVHKYLNFLGAQVVKWV